MAAVQQPLDELAAGSLWRAHKLQSFRDRARALGLADDPAVARALEGVAEHTEALEALAARQRDGTQARPWWADGEYDDTRADAANDAGMACLQRKELLPAYDAFTEAIRLSPSKAAYHANRAAVALQLNNAAGAAEDAERALALSPDHVAARLRAAKACMALQHAERAVAHYEHVLRLKPEHSTALSGRAAATQLAHQQRTQAAQAAASALRGERPALLRLPVTHDAAAEQLLAAEAMLKAQPSLEAAKCAHVEALILCRAYGAALEACTRLQPDSVDGAYLKAEAQWRSGNLEAASATLQAPHVQRVGSGKCTALASFLEQLAANYAAAGDAAEPVAAYSKLLGDDAVQGTHMQALLLRRRAAAQADRARAIADLDAALEVHASDVEALVQRAHLHRTAGDADRCFLDLRAAHILAPQRPGAWQALQSAAKAALRRGAARSSAAPPGTPGGADAASLPRSYRVLGVTLAATQREITHAYRMLAAKWHPDKWATATEDKQKLAEQRFRVVADAYETLRDPDTRARHDRDHFFSAARHAQ